MKMENIYEKFLHSKAAANLAPRTLEYYEDMFKMLDRWLKKQGITDVEQINQTVLEDYMIYVRGRYANATIKGRYIVLAILFRWIHKSEIIAINPMDDLHMPKLAKRLVPSFSKSEIGKILSIFDKNDFLGLRNYTIMLTLFGTGIRKSELLGLKLSSLQSEFIRVIGKGNKERLVPISNALKIAFKNYLRARKQFLDDSYSTEYLWINKDQNPLRTTGINQIFRIIKDANPEWTTRVSAHTFRHTFALMYIKNGGDVFSLKDILGHEDIATTKIYIDMNKEDMKSQFSKYNPLDNTHWKYL